MNENKQEKLNEQLRAVLKSGNLILVKELVGKGANIHMKDEQFLMDACHNGYLDIVKYLIEEGANVHFKNKYGDTPLHWAAYQGNSEIVKFLIIEHDYDPEIAIKSSKMSNKNIVFTWCENYIKSKELSDKLEFDLCINIDKINIIKI